MKTPKHIIPTAIIAMLTLQSTSAAIIASDAAGFQNWFKGSTTGTLTKGETLVWAERGSNNEEVIMRSFTDTTLALGETMRFTADWTQSSGSAGIVRMGLSDANPDTGGNGDVTFDGDGFTGSGYYSFIRDNSTYDSLARYENFTSFTPLTGSNASFGTNSTQTNLIDNGTKTYSLVFDVTYVSTGQVDTLFTILDGATAVYSLSGTTTANILNTFDTASFRVSGGTATLDNLEISVVPEPSTYALLAGLAMFGLVLRRRRNRNS